MDLVGLSESADAEGDVDNALFRGELDDAAVLKQNLLAFVRELDYLDAALVYRLEHSVRINSVFFAVRI